MEKRINENNLIYKYKTEGMCPKYFSDNKNPIDSFKNLRDGIINPKEVLKNQFNLKSDLGETKKCNPKSRLENKISVIENTEKFF